MVGWTRAALVPVKQALRFLDREVVYAGMPLLHLPRLLIKQPALHTVCSEVLGALAVLVLVAETSGDAVAWKIRVKIGVQTAKQKLEFVYLTLFSC